VNQLTALASSSLNTTVDDFILWMKSYETGEVGGDAMLARRLQRGVLNGGDTIAYAYGLSVGEYRGLPTFGHGGSWAGFRTDFVRFPQQNLSIVVFCNVSNCDPGGRARRVAEVFLEAQMGPAPQGGAAEGDDSAIVLTTAQLSSYTGVSRSPELDSTYELVLEGGTLVAHHWRNESATLAPVGDDEFASDRPWLPVVRFTRDGSGRITGFTASGSRVRNLVFERQPAGQPATSVR
jgi:hypothetical protein